MSQSSAERLKAYLSQLPPRAQALLMREFERSLERGDNAVVANFVLGELRKIVRAGDVSDTPRHNDAQRLLFQPLDAYLVESHTPPAPGQIRRQSLASIWIWLTREGAPDAARVYADAINDSADPSVAVKAFQVSAADAIAALLAEVDQGRSVARIGPASAAEDLPAIGAVLRHVDALGKFQQNLPGQLRAFGPSQILSVAALLIGPLQSPQLLPFALRIIMQRLTLSWQIIRLAIQAAATDDATRVASHPLGVVVPIVIEDLSQMAARLRDDIKRGQFSNACDQVKMVHDGVRGLRTELDIRSDSAWGKSLAKLRVDMSGTLKAEIENVPGRVRRLLRQRPDKDVSAGTRLDPVEIDETVALIDFVAVCRSFASELAINEVTLRTYADLQSYIENSTETLVDTLRHCDPRVQGLREQQARAAIRFCEVLFGHDYAVLMGRSADNALASERKPARVG